MKSISLASLGLLICLAATPVQAQSSMFGSGSVSNRNSAGAMSPSSGFSGFGTGGSGLGGLGGGMGGGGLAGLAGMAGLGGNTGGLGNLAANRGNGGIGTGNQQGGFVGRNANPNQFIGANANTGGNNGMNQGQFQGNQRQGNRGGARSLFSQNGNEFNQNNSAQTQAPILRARQKIAFNYAQNQLHTRQPQLQMKFTKLVQRNEALQNVAIAAENNTVILRGEVSSAADARLAEKLVRLEPGVRAVQNELTYPDQSAE